MRLPRASFRVYCSRPHDGRSLQHSTGPCWGTIKRRERHRRDQHRNPKEFEQRTCEYQDDRCRVRFRVCFFVLYVLDEIQEGASALVCSHFQPCSLHVAAGVACLPWLDCAVPSGATPASIFGFFLQGWESFCVSFASPCRLCSALEGVVGI